MIDNKYNDDNGRLDWLLAQENADALGNAEFWLINLFISFYILFKTIWFILFWKITSKKQSER